MAAAVEHGSSAPLTAEVVQASGVSVYKVIADEAGTLRGYNSRIVAAPDAGEKGQQEWRGLYTQFKREHALGTIGYRWDRGHKVARLIRATFDEDLSIVVLDGPMTYAGGISGIEKAKAAKELLGIDPELPLLAALGERRQVCLVRETEDEWELVIPHELLPHLSLSETGVARFEKHQSWPTTHRWQIEEQSGEGSRDSDSPWSRWDDDVPPARASALIPDLDLPAKITAVASAGGGDEEGGG